MYNRVTVTHAIEREKLHKYGYLLENLDNSKYIMEILKYMQFDE
jgi:hypothetical protein